MSREQQRAELHRTIWNAANQLVHGGVLTPVQFMNYMLGGLFYRFISENITDHHNKEMYKAGYKDFDYTKLADDVAENARHETTKEKGFYILPSELFVNVAKHAKEDANLNETLEKVFKNIEGSAIGFGSENDIKGLFDDFDVNSKILGDTVQKRNEQLRKLLEVIGSLQMGEFSNHVIDTFGDAYEYLISMYAANFGKKGGEFYTPQEVSELLTKITLVGKTEVNKVYDPACGSGSLLLNFSKILGEDKVRQGFFGQEIILTTYNLCRMNMFLHNINYVKFNIANGNTLTDPKHWDDEPFEAIVSNPPYSTIWDGADNPLLINDPRFSPAGVLAPKSKSDLAFVMHMLSWLATNGTAAIVEFPGVLYRGHAEQKIRKYLIDNNYIDCIIQLPANLFFGTTIATCIIVLKKSKTDNATLFIDASKESVHSGNKEKLAEENIAKILNAFIERNDKLHFARLVPNAEIAANGYNIAVSSYVEQEDTREVVNIVELNAKIAEIVKREDELRKAIDEIVNDLEGDNNE
jgi:type I restriction enzyme M protein